ncbi:hypothetical protein [Oleiharenicola lentus]|uniref:hypothetical protein n=1 Tax=Oleiharenicola lentus TaxID=2508720 RepID=UPI003F6800A6
MNWRDVSRPKSILIDAVVIAIVITGSNLLFDRAHPGWVNLSPSPYLLLPLLVGGRYGFTSGVLAGIGASALVLVQQHFSGQFYSVNHALSESVYLHAGFLFIGGIAGELFGWFRRERVQSEAQQEKLQTSVRQLDSDVNYLRGVKDELDRLVAARDGEVSALDTELRRLYATSADDLPVAVLQFLRRQVRLSDAALYRVDRSDGALQRIAFIGREAHLPASLARDASEIVQLALQRSSLVTLPEILQQREPAANEPLLLVAPLLNASGEVTAILVVTGMPFISFTAQTANLIELVCEWAGEVLDLAQGAAGRYRIVSGRENQRLFTRNHFEHLLQLALIAYQRHRLPSSVVIFSLPGAPASEQARFEQALISTVRAGDYAAELGRSEPHLAVLLPLVGERGANIFIERCRHFLRNTGPWPVEVEVRRVEFGHAENVKDVLAEIDGVTVR